MTVPASSGKTSGCPKEFHSGFLTQTSQRIIVVTIEDPEPNWNEVHGSRRNLVGSSSITWIIVEGPNYRRTKCSSSNLGIISKETFFPKRRAPPSPGFQKVEFNGKRNPPCCVPACVHKIGKCTDRLSEPDEDHAFERWVYLNHEGNHLPRQRRE